MRVPSEHQEQEAWIRALTAEGYCCAVCHGWEAARDEILHYIKEDK